MTHCQEKNTARDYLETGDQSPASKEKTSNNVLQGDLVEELIRGLFLLLFHVLKSKPYKMIISCVEAIFIKNLLSIIYI